jgi:formylglycine-generating enzyme required for sulfatase activity
VAEIRINLNDFESWIAALRPARDVLFDDLNRIFSKSENSEIDRYAAATALADFAKDQPIRLVDLALRATPGEYPPLIARLKLLGDLAKNSLQSEFNVAPGAGAIDEQNRIAKRRAHAAVALLEFDDLKPLMTVLSEQGKNPILDSYAEYRLSNLGTNAETLLRLFASADTPLRASLLRSLAGINFNLFSGDLREKLVTIAADRLKNDPDSGVHSAAEWALRSWGKQSPPVHERLMKLMNELAMTQHGKDRGWYINGHGHTMIVFDGPIEATIGSPDDEPGRDASDEKICLRRIDRDFAVCSTEVTVKQFLKLIPTFRHKKTDYAPTPECPVTYVTWYRAAEYCNLLSKAEGIPKEQWCYRKCEVWTKTPEKPLGDWLTTFQPQEDCLSRTGYRLLTEAEWEYACRARSTRPFSWGGDAEISNRYAWTIRNSEGISWPVGSLCPNRYGIFDMHGNASEWTNDRYSIYRPPFASDEWESLPKPLNSDQEPSKDAGGKPLPIFGGDINGNPVPFPPDTESSHRGGSAAEIVWYQRSANRTSNKVFDGVSARLGFRIARTVPQTRGLN